MFDHLARAVDQQQDTFAMVGTTVSSVASCRTHLKHHVVVVEKRGSQGGQDPLWMLCWTS